MVATSAAVDLGSATEFAPDDDADVFIEARLMQVFDEGGEAIPQELQKLVDETSARVRPTRKASTTATWSCR